LFDEPGADRVERALPEALISAANLAEVIAKLVDRGLDGNEALSDLRELDMEVVALDRAQAEAAGLLRSAPLRAKQGSRSAIGPAWLWPSRGARRCLPRISGRLRSLAQLASQSS
jgi:PIN domain nuclease of toxin-antitoxin system